MDPIGESTIIVNEPLIRLSFFAGILAVMVLAETLLPRKNRTLSRRLRWTNNLALIGVNGLLVRLIFPVSLLWLAADASLSRIGLFNLVDLPFWPAVILSVILLDLAIYWQHRLFHTVPLLWRLHRMHHADQDIDVTTGLRFHPVEILLSLVIKAGIILIIGAPALAVLIFEIVLNGMAQFNHANMRLPPGLERWLRLLVVTPDFHRVHHSDRPEEFNNNYGFNLSCWDRLFGSYVAQPAAGHDGMVIGLKQFREKKDQRLDQMLIQPFRGR